MCTIGSEHRISGLPSLSQFTASSRASMNTDEISVYNGKVASRERARSRTFWPGGGHVWPDNPHIPGLPGEVYMLTGMSSKAHICLVARACWFVQAGSAWLFPLSCSSLPLFHCAIHN